MEEKKNLDEIRDREPEEELEVEPLSDEDLESAAGGYCSACCCSTAPQ